MNDIDNTADVPDIKKDEVQHDMPLAIKLGLLGLIVTLAVAGYFGYGLYQSNKTLDDHVSLVVSEEYFSEEKAQSTIRNIENMITTSEGALTLPVEDAAANDGEAIVKLSDSFDGLARNVDEVNLVISKAKDARLLLSEEIKHNHMLVSLLKNDLIDIRKEMSVLSDTVASQSKKATQSLRAKKTVKRAVRPPFALLSIDQWGGKSSAVIGLSGKALIANIGDIRSGWRIDSINHPDCIRVVRISDAIATNVCRGGGERR